MSKQRTPAATCLGVAALALVALAVWGPAAAQPDMSPLEERIRSDVFAMIERHLKRGWDPARGELPPPGAAYPAPPRVAGRLYGYEGLLTQKALSVCVAWHASRPDDIVVRAVGVDAGQTHVSGAIELATFQCQKSRARQRISDCECAVLAKNGDLVLEVPRFFLVRTAHAGHRPGPGIALGRYTLLPLALVLVDESTGRELGLTPRETRLLGYLREVAPRLASYAELRSNVWEGDPVATRDLIESTIFGLRRRLRQFGADSLLEVSAAGGVRLTVPPGQEAMPRRAPAPVERVPFAASWEGTDELLSGELAYDDEGGGTISAVWPGEGVRCTGTWHRVSGDETEAEPARGVWSVACENGLAASGTFTSREAGRGTGSGSDTEGRAVKLSFGS